MYTFDLLDIKSFHFVLVTLVKNVNYPGKFLLVTRLRNRVCMLHQKSRNRLLRVQAYFHSILPEIGNKALP